jgi:hypothetical protein
MRKIRVPLVFIEEFQEQLLDNAPCHVFTGEPEHNPTFKGLWQRMENFSETTAVPKT